MNSNKQLIINKIYFSICLLTWFPVQIISQPADASKDKYAGIFYFAWLGQHPSEQKGNYDITDLFEYNREDLFNKQGTPKSPKGQYHFWGEPLFGYYNSADPWVIMRHIELLTEAGIDYIMIDATNSFYYPEVMSVLLEKLLYFQKQGYRVPQVAFYTNSHSGTTVDRIYEHFYQAGRYEDLWFKPEGKPFIIGITTNNKKASDQLLNPDFDDFISQKMIAYFDVRESQWPIATFNPDAFPWISWVYPQIIQNGVLPVSVAQHSPVNVVFSDTIYAKGRGYDAVKKTNNHHLSRTGKNFRDQWNTVFENKNDVEHVFITGWNEWIAIKTVINDKVAFVDAFNEEFSRDVEMMKGGYGDHFYLQMKENIRRFKGQPAGHVRQAEISIHIKDNDLSQWNKAMHYKDFAGDALNRDFQDFSGNNRYTDTSARNDITDIRVAHDNDHVYFLIKTNQNIIPHNGKDLNWMNIFIKTTGEQPKFMDYNYVINRFPDKDGTSVVEKSEGGYQWKEAGISQYRIFGSYMAVSVPLKVLGMTHEHIAFSFKVSDNVTNYMDKMDYYVSGDSAPIGGLSYEYGAIDN